MSEVGFIENEEYSQFVAPKQSEEETIYVQPLPITSKISAVDHKQDKIEDVYEVPSSIPRSNASKVSEKSPEKVVKSNLHQFKSKFQKSEAATALSRAFKFPKNILSSDHFQFSKDAKRSNLSSSKQNEEDIYVDAEDATFSASYRKPKKRNPAVAEILPGTQMKEQADEEAGMIEEVEKRNSMAPSCELRQSCGELNDLNDQANDENTEPLYLDFSNETQSDESSEAVLPPIASNEVESTSMGAKSSKKTNHKSKKDISQPQLSATTSNRYGVQLRKKHVSSVGETSNSQNRPISMPPCDPPEPPQIGQRPLPPTPGWSNDSLEDSDIPGEYSDINETEASRRNRKSSMPNQPPPLPPVTTERNDDEDDDNTNPNNFAKPPRPAAPPARNFVLQNRKPVQKPFQKSASSDVINSPSRKIHPIAQLLKTKQHSSLSKRLPSDSNAPENKDHSSASQQKMSGNFETAAVQTSSIKNRTPAMLQPFSKSRDNLSRPPPRPTYRNSPMTANKPHSIPNKPPQYSADHLQRRATTDAINTRPKIPSRSVNNRLSLQTQSENNSISSTTKNKLKNETPQDSFPKAPKVPTKVAEPSQDSKSQPNQGDHSASSKKRISGYTLHKLQAERIGQQQNLAKITSTPVFNSSTSPQISIDASDKAEASAIDLDDDNTYHTIDSDDDTNPLKTSKENKKLSSLLKETLAVQRKEDDADKNVSRSASQKSNSSGALPKSPKIKPKPRPNVPPPPRPTDPAPSPPKEAKHTGPPSRPPPPSKQKIVEAKMRKQISASNDMFSSGFVHSSPQSIVKLSNDENKRRNKAIKNTKGNNSLTMEKEDEAYYSAIPQTNADPKIPAKSVATKSNDARDKKKSKKEFAAVANTVFMVKSKINKYAKRGNETVTATSETTNPNTPEYWREDSFEDDDEDDIEGIYMGIDDDFPDKNNESGEYLTSITTSQR